MRHTKRWELPEVTFYRVEDHGFPGEHEGRPLYAYGAPDDMDRQGRPKTGELYNSLDRSLIAWVGEKYTGPRGARGTGVGTAADWFARMIGMGQLVGVNHDKGQRALLEAVTATQDEDGPLYSRARAIGAELEARGLTLATRVEPTPTGGAT